VLTGLLPRLGAQAAKRQAPNARDCLKLPSSSFFPFCSATPRASSHSHPPTYLLSVPPPLATILVSTAAAKLPLSPIFSALGDGLAHHLPPFFTGPGAPPWLREACGVDLLAPQPSAHRCRPFHSMSSTTMDPLLQPCCRAASYPLPCAQEPHHAPHWLPHQCLY
jgi:hypothetical protein